MHTRFHVGKKVAVILPVAWANAGTCFNGKSMTVGIIRQQFDVDSGVGPRFEPSMSVQVEGMTMPRRKHMEPNDIALDRTQNRISPERCLCSGLGDFSAPEGRTYHEQNVLLGEICRLHRSNDTIAVDVAFHFFVCSVDHNRAEQT